MTLRASVIGAARMILGLVPDALLGRLLPGRLGWRADPLPVSVRPQGEVRLLVAPVNSAGQGFLWARAAEGIPGVGAANLETTSAAMAAFGFAADVSVPEGAYLFARGWQRRQRRAVRSGFTHVLLESGRFLYGTDPMRTPLEVARETADHGLRVGLLWHGSDIRVPSSHARFEQDSPFGERGAYPPEATRVLEARTLANRRMVDDSDFPVFVSTPGLLDVPRSTWLPVVVDAARWRTDRRPFEGGIPVVAYVPSNAPLKGSPQVDEQLTALEREGVIVYRRLERVPADRMPMVYGEADIVLDQFRLGDYGVAACEAMAAGRLVLGHVHPDVRQAVRRETGLELPIVETRFDEVGDRIREILVDPGGWSARAAAGPAFVDAVHDGTASARAMEHFLLDGGTEGSRGGR
ncbi:glycosyltransferase family 4 protein [Microbacterium sp. 2FI]|uniref:glycosyltransferase family 4 protein n=1 Tax=Microbacterium sp. 2FI TaxID=2502193 RepID=UPI0010F8206C|nr:glycosyltransferase family 4 protein [Microbacterium sp. 2FI]